MIARNVAWRNGLVFPTNQHIDIRELVDGRASEQKVQGLLEAVRNSASYGSFTPSRVEGSGPAVELPSGAGSGTTVIDGDRPLPPVKGTRTPLIRKEIVARRGSTKTVRQGIAPQPSNKYKWLPTTVAIAVIVLVFSALQHATSGSEFGFSSPGLTPIASATPSVTTKSAPKSESPSSPHSKAPPRTARVRRLSDADVGRVVASLKQATLASAPDLRRFHGEHRFFVTGTSVSDVAACLRGRDGGGADVSDYSRACAPVLEEMMHGALPQARAAPAVAGLDLEWPWAIHCLVRTTCVEQEKWDDFTPESKIWQW
ncbi:hypothetical protein PG993_014870 [Apiospora rasikravindrae]|uniref:Uncharacterized protein n=1 Tax=Apiospora rasikravindrae TaxID=990691 RepID=A0ABR1RNY9_9PEZI